VTLNQDIKNRLTGLIQDASTAPFKFTTLLQVLKDIVFTVECVCNSYPDITSPEKKAVAMDAISFVFESVAREEFHIPSWLDEYVIKALSSVLVDWLVSILNESGVFTHKDPAINKAA